MTPSSEVRARKNEVTHRKFCTNVHCDGIFYFLRRILLRNMIKGNAQFIQNVIFELSIDYKKTIMEVGSIAKAATFKSFPHLTY